MNQKKKHRESLFCVIFQTFKKKKSLFNIFQNFNESLRSSPPSSQTSSSFEMHSGIHKSAPRRPRQAERDDVQARCSRLPTWTDANFEWDALTDNV